jgi:hypothetical protein
MHTQLGHASAEAILHFLEGGILPAGVDSITRADIKRVISKCIICEHFGSKPLRHRTAIPSDVKFNESVHMMFLLHRWTPCVVICVCWCQVHSG